MLSNNKANNIKYIAFKQNNKDNFFQISDFKINPKFKESYFKPKLPKDCQIIELD